MDDWASNVMSSAKIEVTTSGAASLTAVASGADAMENQRGERGLPCGVPSLKTLSLDRASRVLNIVPGLELTGANSRRLVLLNKSIPVSGSRL